MIPQLLHAAIQQTRDSHKNLFVCTAHAYINDIITILKIASVSIQYTPPSLKIQSIRGSTCSGRSTNCMWCSRLTSTFRWSIPWSCSHLSWLLWKSHRRCLITIISTTIFNLHSCILTSNFHMIYVALPHPTRMLKQPLQLHVHKLLLGGALHWVDIGPNDITVHL